MTQHTELTDDQTKAARWLDEVRQYLTAAADSSMSRNNSEQLAYELLEALPEARKDDEALIRKMLDYLEEMQDEGPTGEGWKSDDLMSVISAATARLEKEGRQHG